MSTFVLPPGLCELMEPYRYLLLSLPTDDGTVLIAKMQSDDIETCRGCLDIKVTYELHSARTGPAVRLVIEIHDRPGAPLTLETFFNPCEADQLADLEDLLRRPHLRMFLCNEQHESVLTKLITQRGMNADEQRRLLTGARRLLALTEPSHMNFDATKTSVMRRYPMITHDG